ncbi:hypothetical protein AMTR_s00058p00110600 [Amborella trichopoda]|uniref:Pentacotripeptide-repeat region of PRORP domain-containing protein n=1 Tax=Amborella trichopoda TaxID=13333 RepID=W1P9F6_AMBTC|nr:hypothetical protein AMTR_s00058p00110600 [Amborella trichopoda]
MREEASKVMDEMLGNGLNPNQVTYIDGHCKSGKLEGALSLMERMEKYGCIPILQTCNAIFNGFGKDIRVSVVEKLFNKMVEKGLKLNVIGYSTWFARSTIHTSLL